MNKWKALASLLFCLSIASFFGKLHFALELLSHFRAHYAAALMLFVALFAATRDGKWCVLSTVVAFANIYPIVGWYAAEPGSEAVDQGNSIRVLAYNVHLHNKEYGSLSALVARVQPDIVGLMEVDLEWLGNLETLQSDYAFRVEVPRDDLWGLALYSKLPITDSSVVSFGESATPSIVATIDAAEAAFEVILTHPAWPLGADSSARRNAQLLEMAQYVRAADVPVLVLADLNTTMWSPYYTEFEKISGLENARAGYGIGATFPSIPLIRIPIDHILMTPPSRVGNFRVHKDIGSDHLPISASIVLEMNDPSHR